MAQNVFLLAQIVVLGIIASGIWIMAKGIVREDFKTFRNSLYWFLGASALSGFMFALRSGMHMQAGGLEMPLLVMSATLGFISVLGISYYYIHTVMPEVFVKAAVFFSVTLLLVNVLSIFPPKVGKAAGTGEHRFMESAKYKQKEIKENKEQQEEKHQSQVIASNP